MTAATLRLSAQALCKTFTLHVQGGVSIPVFNDLSFEAHAGRCVALAGPSGAGKSTLLRSLYGNYLPDSGHIRLWHRKDWVDLTQAQARTILEIRRETLGHVSQFLRAVPRVSALDVVAEPLLALGVDEESARRRAAELLARLNLPERLWNLAPATFSGGEQQRVNVARGFAPNYPILLLDEPTASLDAKNRRVVVDLIAEAKSHGAALVGIFHDQEVRDAVADDIFEVESYKEPVA
ncbi:MAG: phosphonate C-P lyase system protein PhnL [Rhodospirillales bacterium]|jgi:alpha-D-ribose 1-methylphosphonate 5-triphosphate synthase subunit PhnL|nr:phosphonate C-P lyase system protein PhnL [Rhodospirillales bacterium]